MRNLTRRAFVGSALLGAFTSRTRAAAAYSFVQYHNQTAASPLHRRLVEMWTAIGLETNGRAVAQVFPNNNGISGSDPAALRALMAGDIQFFTLMGGILGTVVPAAEVQQVPFAFRSAGHAHQAMDGPLGAYLRGEMAAKGLVGFPVGAFDNGMRQIGGTKRPIVRPEDLAWVRMRVPAGQMVADTFRVLGAEPVTINSDGIYAALEERTGRRAGEPAGADGTVQARRGREVREPDEPYVVRLQPAGTPADVGASAGRYPDRRRAERREVCASAAAGPGRPERRGPLRMEKRGLAFNEIEAAAFRAQLTGFYTDWKNRLGSKCWSLLNLQA